MTLKQFMKLRNRDSKRMRDEIKKIIEQRDTNLFHLQKCVIVLGSVGRYATEHYEVAIKQVIDATIAARKAVCDAD